MIYINRNVNEYNKMLCKICKQQLTFARFEKPMATCYANISANDPQVAARSCRLADAKKVIARALAVLYIHL